ncbi:MAG: toxic anion resistance protein [Clostridia bacterium]|nr:toxic anion resistance protein [Clostridia bacterium]
MSDLELTVKPEIDTTEIEKGLIENRKVEEAQVEKSLNYDALTEAEKQAIDVFLSKLDVTDTNQVLQYGVGAQTKISKFSDSVLDNVKTKSTGEVGGLLTDLVVQIKDFDSDVPKDGKMPTGLAGIFNSAKKQIQKLIAKYDKVENNVDKIEKQLENHKLQMMKDIAVFDTMYEKNLEYFKELSLYIIAGEKKLEELKTVTLPEMQKKAEESGDQTDIQAVNDMSNMINRFEKKIYDLKTTRIISIQMAPQIRLIQNNDTELVEKIQSSIINTIPLWKNQIVIALGLTNAKNALGAQKQVTDITNEMLKKNSELLKQGTIEVAKESERAIVDVETLQKTNKDIIDTLDTILQIHAEGRQKRADAEVELQRIEGELKDKLLEIEVAANNQ